ncbi:MAG TPA: MFS transporter [Candidatus Limnocylindria bacterium]|nr:MFS transporter [Candidatus Limnocylindria bacterium]
MTASAIVPEHVVTQEFRTPVAVRRGILAGVVGNMLEWYDFALFGFFATQIGQQFFPADNPTASLLAAFGTFAAGFLMRPVGGAVFGWIGDRFGRKQALIGSVLAMALPSFLIGVLPGAATIGLAAPVLLVLLRMLQGVAVGGEYMASAVFLVEGAEPGHRGWMGSWGPFGASAGTLLGSAAGAIVNATLSPEAVLAWGWRVPFIVGITVALGGLAIRRHYVERVPQQAESTSPLGEAFRAHWRTMVHLVGLTTAISVGFYTTFVYSATWLQQVAGVTAGRALEINTVAMALLLVISPLAGSLSDRVGRRTVMAWGAGALMLLAWPLMGLMLRGTVGGILAGQVGLALLVGGVGSVLPAAMAELAPWRVRCTVLSVGYNIALALVGGTTPMIAAWLVERTGVKLAPAAYLAAASVITFIAALMLPRVARHRLTHEFKATRLR